jgi:hypothetical protein
MKIVCTDLEGVLVPEIWINVALKTGIDELKLTTRDISDYDVLMRKRLDILDQKGLKLKDITDVIATMVPLDGALDFLDWLRARTQVIIVSDTFTEFAAPLMAQLGGPPCCAITCPSTTPGPSPPTYCASKMANGTSSRPCNGSTTRLSPWGTLTTTSACCRRLSTASFFALRKMSSPNIHSFR